MDALPEVHMPKGWFFDIHVDTPGEEAANLMEHSASTLDISSDDDADTRRRNEEREMGKENVPPPDNFANLPAAAADLVTASTSAPAANASSASKKQRRARKSLHPDAMATDRTPLADLDATDFFPDGLNASSKVVVPADVTSPPHKPSSGLAKEFDFAIPSPKAKLEAARGSAKGKAKAVMELEVEVETQSKEIFICEDES